MTTATVEHDRAGAALLTVGSVFWVVAGLYLAGWQIASAPAPARGVEALGDVAFGLVYAMPGVLGFVALRRRALLVAAIASGFALTLTAFTLAPIFLVFSLLLVWARVRRGGGSLVRARAAALVTLALVAGAWFAIKGHDDAYCWSSRSGITMTPDAQSGSVSSAPGESAGGGCGSDIVTRGEGLRGLLIVLATPFVAWRVAGRDATRSAGSQPGSPGAFRGA